MIQKILIILLLLLTQLIATNENNISIKALSDKIQIEFVNTTHTLPDEILNRLSAELSILRENQDIPLLKLLEENDEKINKSYDFIFLKYHLLIKEAIERGDENSAIAFTNKLIQFTTEKGKNLTEEQLSNYALLGKVYKNFQNEEKSQIAYHKRLEIFRTIKKDMPKERFEVLRDNILKDANEDFMVSVLFWLLMQIIFFILMVKQAIKTRGVKAKLFIIFRYFFICAIFILLITLGISFLFDKDMYQDASNMKGIFLLIVVPILFLFIHTMGNQYIKNISISNSDDRQKPPEQSISTEIDEEELIAELEEEEEKERKETLLQNQSVKRRDFQACRNCNASEVEIENGIYVCAYCGTAIGTVS